MATRLLPLLALWTAAALPRTTTAQIPPNACLDRSGAPVRPEESTELPNPAWASWVGNHQPAIYWNRQAMAGASEVSKLFVYLHECAHITLRHIYGHVTTIEAKRKQEDEADCWAIQLMLDAGMIKGRHLAQLEREWRHSRGDLTRQSGAELVHSFQRCLSLRTDQKLWHVALDSLLTAARDSFHHISGQPIAESGGERARESTLDLPGTYECEIRATGNFFCPVFVSREAKPAARRQQELARVLRHWMGSGWTVAEREFAEGPETRQLLAEHAGSGAIIALSATSGGRVLFLARPATR